MSGNLMGIGAVSPLLETQKSAEILPGYHDVPEYWSLESRFSAPNLIGEDPSVFICTKNAPSFLRNSA